MCEFIKIQYRLYKLGNKSIGIEKIKQLAEKYLSLAEYDELFNSQG